MKFITATETCLKKWTTFSGRASRSEYWFFFLFYMIAVTLLNVETNCINHVLDQMKLQPTPSIGALIALLVALVIIMVFIVWLAVALISATVRRLHDGNHSGWWYWIVLTIIGGLFPLLFWYCRKGTTGPNRFGADPLKNIEG